MARGIDFCATTKKRIWEHGILISHYLASVLRVPKDLRYRLCFWTYRIRLAITNSGYHYLFSLSRWIFYCLEGSVCTFHFPGKKMGVRHISGSSQLSWHVRSQTSDHTRDFKEKLNTLNIVVDLVTLFYHGHFTSVQVTESSSPASNYSHCDGSFLYCYVLSSLNMSEGWTLDQG